MELISQGNTMHDQSTPAGAPAKTTRPKRKPQRPRHTLRLSWPKANDNRRSVVGISPPQNAAGREDRPTSETRFIHISLGDVEMHRHLNSDSRSRDLCEDPCHSLDQLTRLRYQQPSGPKHTASVEPSETAGEGPRLASLL